LTCERPVLLSNSDDSGHCQAAIHRLAGWYIYAHEKPIKARDAEDGLAALDRFVWSGQNFHDFSTPCDR